MMADLDPKFRDPLDDFEKREVTLLGKTKRVTENGVADIRNNLAAYTVVQAESHEAAAKLFLNHPHFAIFPGDGVEIMECLPIPSMK